MRYFLSVFLYFLLFINVSTTGYAADIVVRSGTVETTTVTGTAGARNHIIIEQNAEIKTNTNNTHGVENRGVSSFIKNFGLIQTQGQWSYGIMNSASGSVVENSSVIQTQGLGGSGLFNAASTSVIKNSGLIQTQGQWSNGIMNSNSGTGSVIRNSGLIQTQDDNAWGIYNMGSNSVIENSSIIQTQGVDAYGFNNTATNSVIKNSGSIQTQGQNAFGIFNTGPTSVIENSGLIQTQGQDAFGIWNQGSNSQIIHQGQILVSGQNGIGIRSIGNNSEIFLDGQITASGQADTALQITNGKQVVFQENAQLVGKIHIDAGTQIEISGQRAGPSGSFQFADHNQINITGKNPIFRQGNQIHRPDISGFTAQRLALVSQGQSIHNQINRHLARAPRIRPIRVASSRLTPDMLAQSQQSAIWGQIFGGISQMDQSDENLAYDRKRIGMISGYDLPYEDHRVGVTFGLMADTMQTNVRSLESDSKTLFVGSYGNFSLGSWDIDPSLVFGYQFQENRRTVTDNLAGIETARSEQHNFMVSPSVSLSRPITLDNDGRYQLRPLARLSYHYGSFGGYQESGTQSSNLSADRSGSHGLNSRIQLSLHHQFGTYHQGGFAVRAGWDYAYRADDQIQLRLGNATADFNGTGQTSQSHGFAGINVYYDVIDGLTVAGDVEISRANNVGTSYNASLTAKYAF